MQNWHQNLDHWLAFDQSLQAHEKGEKGCHFHFVKSLDQFFLDWFSIARSSSWFWDGQLACQVLLSWKEEKEKLVKEAKHHEKPNSRLSLHQEYFSFSVFQFFSISVFQRKKENTTKSQAHNNLCRVFQFGARGMVSYFRSIWARPARILRFIPHCISYFVHGLYLSSSYICFGRASVSQLVPSLPLDCTKWGPSQNLISFKALWNVYMDVVYCRRMIVSNDNPSRI